MGCVLQPGEDIPTAALKPGDTTSEAVQPGQDIDFCFVAPSEVAQINNVSRFFQTPTVSPNEASLGWELQSGGFSVIIESADTGGGPPDFFTQNLGTDWVIPRPPVGVYHARWNQTGGGGSADLSSTAQNVWVPLSGGLIFNMTEQFDGFYQIQALVEISDDGGLSVLDSATVDLQFQIDP